MNDYQNKIIVFIMVLTTLVAAALVLSRLGSTDPKTSWSEAIAEFDSGINLSLNPDSSCIDARDALNEMADKVSLAGNSQTDLLKLIQTQLQCTEYSWNYIRNAIVNLHLDSCSENRTPSECLEITKLLDDIESKITNKETFDQIIYEQNTPARYGNCLQSSISKAQLQACFNLAEPSGDLVSEPLQQQLTKLTELLSPDNINEE